MNLTSGRNGCFQIQRPLTIKNQLFLVIIFFNTIILSLKDEINFNLKKKVSNLTLFKENIKTSILRYLKAFNLVK